MDDKEIKPLEPGRYIGTFLDSEVGMSQINQTPYRRYRFLVEGHVIYWYQMRGSHLPLEPGSQYSVMVRNERYQTIGDGSMTDNLRPPHAISIWSNNEFLFVELPDAETGEGPSHLLKLPLNVWGLTQILSIAQERSRNSKIGDEGDPTQVQADKAIKEMQRLAAGYNKPITKPKPKVPLTTQMSEAVKEAMRKAGII